MGNGDEGEKRNKGCNEDGQRDARIGMRVPTRMQSRVQSGSDGDAV